MPIRFDVRPLGRVELRPYAPEFNPGTTWGHAPHYQVFLSDQPESWSDGFYFGIELLRDLHSQIGAVLAKHATENA